MRDARALRCQNDDEGDLLFDSSRLVRVDMPIWGYMGLPPRSGKWTGRRPESSQVPRPCPIYGKLRRSGCFGMRIYVKIHRSG